MFLVERGEILDARPFPEDPPEIADRLGRLEAGEILDEERDLVDDVPDFRVSEERLMHLEGAAFAELDVMPDAVEERAPDPDLLRRASLSEAERKATEVVEDQLLVQEVEAMAELQRIENLLDERLREWEPIAGDAAGGHAEALESVQGLLDDVAKRREAMEARVAETVASLAPNTSTVATPGVAARLIAMAGGIEDLARMPSGTIQTLGAEDALFAHLTEGADPPKHGVIFQNPMVHRSPYRARGRISRALAAKIAIAARADAYTGGEIGEQLVEELEEKVAEIKRRS